MPSYRSFSRIRNLNRFSDRNFSGRFLADFCFLVDFLLWFSYTFRSIPKFALFQISFASGFYIPSHHWRRIPGVVLIKN